jgi:NADPH:quinone reductase-like Zn-dependent oxidoreductase
MQSLTSPSYTSPANYTLSILSTPSISSPDDVLIKVHAASINPIDVKKAAGLTRMMESATFPYKIGYDMSGTVEQVGDGVKDIKVGDEVFTMLPEGNRGQAPVPSTCHSYLPAFSDLSWFLTYLGLRV